MAQSYFVWNGKDCRAMGITMRGPAAIIRPEERVTHVEIPGRSGDLTETEGENIYNAYIQTVSISVIGGRRMREVFRWLRGSGYVTFSGEPDKRQKARVIGAITLNRVSRNMDRWAGECQFYCQPLKERMSENSVTLTYTGNPLTVVNAGDVIARPLYKVIASGIGFTFKAVGDDTPEANTIAVTGTTAGHTYWIDSDTMEVLNYDKSIKLTKYSTGDFPVLGQGENDIIGDGWSSIEIWKRERFL